MLVIQHLEVLVTEESRGHGMGSEHGLSRLNVKDMLLFLIGAEHIPFQPACEFEGRTCAFNQCVQCNMNHHS